MANTILALVGMCGAGKTIVTDFYRQKGWKSVYFGEATMDELKSRGLEINEKNEKIVREELRKRHGMGAYAIINLQKIEDNLKRSNVIIDGLYSWSEYKILKEKFGDDLKVLAIFAPKKLRYERLSDRTVRPLTFKESQSRDYSEIENLEKGGPIAIADFTVVNDGSVQDLREKLAKIQLQD